MDNRQNSINQLINPTLTSKVHTVSKSKPDPSPCLDCGLMVEPRFIGNKAIGGWVLPVRCSDCQQFEEIKLFNRQAQKAIRSKREIWKNNMQRLLDEIIPPLFARARITQLDCGLRNVLLGDKSVLLWGGVGVGKTHASMATVREAILSGHDSKRVSFENLLAEIRNFQISEDEILKPYYQSDLLVIDDIGQSDSDFSARMLFRLIDYRIEYQHKTIIMSNLAPEVLREVVGERIFSRLGSYEIIKLSGRDRRSQQGAFDK